MVDTTAMLIILTGTFVAVTLVVPTRRYYPTISFGSLKAGRLAVQTVISWAVLLALLSALKHIAFNSSAYDLGIFDQTIWNSAHGHFFENSLMADSPNFLGHHFSPILLTLVPAYWIIPNPIILLVIQSFLLALAGIPIYLLARDLLQSRGLAFTLLLGYLLHPATAYIALFDFHEIVFATPLLSTALYFLLHQRYKLFGIAVALTLLVKEDMGLLVAALGIFIALSLHKWRIGLGLAAAGMLCTLLLVNYVIPSFHPSGEYYFVGALYSNLGSTPTSIATALLSDPIHYLGQMFAPNKVAYLLLILMPLGGLPLLGWPVLLTTIPSFSALLLSNSLPPELIRYQYSAPLLPIVLAASVIGLRRLRERLAARWTTIEPPIIVSVLTLTFLTAYLYGPLPLARKFDPLDYIQAPRLASARELIAQIPSEASVIAQSGLVPQLSQRRTIQLFAYADPMLRPDYYFLDTAKNAQRYPLPQDQDEPYLKALSRVTADAEYKLIANRDGYLLFKRDTPDPGTLIEATFGDQITLVGYKLANKQIPTGGSIRLATFWRAERKPEANYSLFVHLVDSDWRMLGQKDGYPVGQYWPTSDWEPGKLLRGDWSVPISQEVPPGRYQVIAGLYDLTTMQRLAVTSQKGTPTANHITLGTVEIIGKE